jgi:polysaccharide biosynthesis/export protein
MGVGARSSRRAALSCFGAGLLICAGAWCAPPEGKANSGTTAADGTTGEYHIGPGDSLNVFVWNHPDLSVTVPVRPDGMISTPLAENVVAVNKTPSELARDLEGALGAYVRAPKVNVIVMAFVGSADQVRVVGQAAKPQSLPYHAGMTLLDVMIAVGGLSQYAAGNRAKIVRGVPPNQQDISVRLNDLLGKGKLKANVEMRPGDVLLIPESRF